MMKNLGISLIAIGTFIAVLTLAASVLALGGGWVSGAAVIGLILPGSGLFVLYKQQQKGLSLATSNLVNTANNVKSTLDYFDEFVSPKLYDEDSLALREKLVVQLNKGFDPIILKNALEWANRVNYINKGWYEGFFKCVADICCHSPSYWIDHVRKSKECWPDSHLHFFNQSSKPRQAKNNFFTFYAKYTSSAVSTLKLFDDISTGIMDSEDQSVMREGLQRLLNDSANPSLLKNALIWAKARYDDTQALFPVPFGNDSNFFERLAVICGIELASKVWAASLPEIRIELA